MARFFSSSRRPATVPGTDRRFVRRPDLSGLFVPQQSGAPLSSSEIDYDDLIVHRSYRSFDPHQPGEVRYFMYELSQKNPGEDEYGYFWKAVRLCRLTRIPRYLRQSGGTSGPHAIFEQQRDVLAALREKQVLFINLIAKSPQLPMIFAYGVQGVGTTPEEAQAAADEAYAVLTYQLDGTYQQLEYTPITLADGEMLARYQAEWQHIAMGRGRPLASGGHAGGSSILDGNRTDVESTNNQLESFVRGMSDKSFMLSLVTVPLSPAEITLAWRNITEKLSDVRSDQDGSRSVSAGVALPLSLGTSLGDTHGNTHGNTASQGVSGSEGVSAATSEGVNRSVTDGVSQSVSATASQGVNASVANGVNASASDSLSQSVTHGQSLSMGDNYAIGNSVSQGAGVTQTDSTSASVGQTNTQGASAAYTEGASQGVSVGQTQGLTNTQSVNQTNSVSESQSVGQSASVGQNWANSIGQSLNAGLTSTTGNSQSQANGLSQSITLGNTQGDSLANAWNQAFGNSFNGGLLGFGGGANTQEGQSGTGTNSNSNSLGLGLTGTGTNTVGVSNSLAQALSQGLNVGESFGGSVGQSASATNSVGASQSVGVGQSLSSSLSQSTAQSAGASQSLSQGLSTSQALSQGLSQGQSLGVTQNVGQGQSLSQGQSLTQGQSLANGMGVGRTESTGMSQTMTQGTSQSVSQGTSQGVSQAVASGTSLTQTAGANQGVATNQALSDAYSVAMSRQASTSTSLGVVPQFGVALSKQTRDEAKRFVGDILEAQMRRYAEGIKSGAFLYQMFLVCPDRETLQGGSGLLKSAFWGAGGYDTQLPQPFHTIDDFENDEAERLLAHAAAFTSYRRREAVADIIEPFAYSTYLTPTEAAAFTHPPTAESLGLQAVADSMPVLRMPHDRQDRQIRLGHIINGERAIVSPWCFGVDVGELTHTLITGVTGSGKTTTLMRFLADAAHVEKVLVSRPTPENPQVTSKTVRPSVLFLDWMRNGRNLASIVDPSRFQFFSLVKPELGRFSWNLLAVPCEGMNPVEWLNAQCDNFVASFNLGEFGRSLLAEFLNELYTANRLEEYVLRKETIDPDTGVVLRPASVLPAIPREQMPDGAIQVAANGTEYANVFTCWELSRCVSMAHLATLVAAKVELLADPNAARLYGTAMRDRLQSLWRRMQYFAPGGQFTEMLGCETDLESYDCLTVDDLVDPDQGMITVLETDGLDFANRRVILGSILLAVYRTGLSRGEGAYDHQGAGPGTFVVLEEAHELFGEQGQDEDAFSASTRTALYESMFRRARALGLRLVAVVQNPASIPAAITSNTSTVLVHQTYDKADKERIFSLLNWSNQIGQQLREFRWLGEMPVGYCIVRLQPKTHYLEAAPVQILTDPAPLDQVSDAQLRAMANQS